MPGVAARAAVDGASPLPGVPVVVHAGVDLGRAEAVLAGRALRTGGTLRACGTLGTDLALRAGCAGGTLRAGVALSAGSTVLSVGARSTVLPGGAGLALLALGARVALRAGLALGAGVTLRAGSALGALCALRAGGALDSGGCTVSGRDHQAHLVLL